MRVIIDLQMMQSIAFKYKLKGKKIGFVPTMGALHEGHLSLIRAARRENDLVVVSIFVNPAQFGPKEDLRRYPRPIKKDLELCKKEGADFIFYPNPGQIYPQGYKTYVAVEQLGQVLCGKSRPAHFRGVTTIVSKLFNIVLPDKAYFGQKDAQQTVVIKRMSQDLNFMTKIKVLPIVREIDGLALSSRNSYLTSEGRKAALVLSQALKLAKELVSKGIKDSEKIISAMRKLIIKERLAKIDYIEIVDSTDLKCLKKVSGECFIVLAVWIGKTRLIDNILIKSKIKG